MSAWPRFSISTISARGAVARIHFATTAGMASVIWFVQLVTYPQFALIGEEVFAAYHDDYTNRVAWIVGPLMLTELATAVLLQRDAILSRRGTPLALIGLTTIGVLWTVTGLVQVPLHGRLACGYDVDAVSALVAANWIRTLLWTLRVPLAARLLAPPS